MKTEDQIKTKIKRLLEKSFNTDNEGYAAKLQAKAETLAWVIDMEGQEFDDYWDKLLIDWEEEYVRRS